MIIFFEIMILKKKIIRGRSVLNIQSPWQLLGRRGAVPERVMTRAD